ncbi:MAG TPA: hypothetical protein PKI03_37120, partial [Pseudomonadota bacterium]|nr:hypothetical protein [Pseudomonadota bacterium]
MRMMALSLRRSPTQAARRLRWLSLVFFFGLCPSLAPADSPRAPAAAGGAAAIPTVFDGAKRIVAVGDIHGDYDKFLAVLKLCQVID